LATYFINFGTGDDSRSAATAQVSTTPWKTIGKYLATVFNSASHIDDTLLLMGTFTPSLTEAGLSTGSWGICQRIITFQAAGSYSTITAKDATSKLTIRQWVESDGPSNETDGAIFPAIITPWFQMSSLTALTTNTYASNAITTHATATRVARVCYRPFDVAGVNPTGLPGLDFRRAMAPVANATNAGARTTAIAATGDDASTGMPVSTFVYNPTTASILVNLGDAANGGGSVLGSIGTTATDWYYSLCQRSGTLDSVCGLGIQENGTTGAGWGSSISGITLQGWCGELGTGHSIALFDASYGKLEGNHVMNGGSHAISISNTAGVAVNEMIIRGNVMEGLAGGNGQGRSMTLLGGGGVGASINGAVISGNRYRMFNPINAAGLPSVQSHICPFALQAGVAYDELTVSGGSGVISVGDSVSATAGSGTVAAVTASTVVVRYALGGTALSSSGTLTDSTSGATRTISARVGVNEQYGAGISDVLIKENSFEWVPSYVADLGVTISSASDVTGSVYGNNGARTDIFNGLANTNEPGDPEQSSSFPIRFIDCSFTGLKQLKLDAGGTTNGIASYSFERCILLFDEYPRCKVAYSASTNAGPAAYGGEGALNLGNGGRDSSATARNIYGFFNSIILVNGALPTANGSTCELLDQSTDSTRTAAFTHGVYFRNCCVGFYGLRRTTGSNEYRMFSFASNANANYANGVYLNAAKNVFVFDAYMPTETSGALTGSVRRFLHNDGAMDSDGIKLSGNGYYNMTAANMSGRAAINNLRGDFQSGSGGDSSAEILTTPRGFSWRLTPLPVAIGTQAESLDLGPKIDTTVRINPRDPFGLRPM